MAIIEACVESLEEVLRAEENGAHRVELCADLSVGGLSPSIELVNACLAERKHLPIFAMVRPRAGNFWYTESEYREMEDTIRLFKSAGVEGVVFGGLTKNNTIDMEGMRRLLTASTTLQTTFHRAFDETINPYESLDRLIGLGFDRVLTSGQAPTALQGASLLKKLVERAAGNIIVLAGSGVNKDNMGQLIDQTRVTEVHGTAFCK